MIIKTIATFPCGSKKFFGTNVYAKGVKVNCVRPHLIEVFISSITPEEKIWIYTGLSRVVHPTKGRVTINGEFMSTVVDTLGSAVILAV